MSEMSFPLMTNLIDDLQSICDKQAIMEVLLLYTRALDRMDWRLLETCYHVDAYHDHGMWKGAALGFVQYCANTLPSMDRTMHVIHNTLINRRSATHASAETYCSALHRVPSTKSIKGFASHTVYMRYIDRFERRDGGAWKIAGRTVVFEWTTVEPIVREWKLTDDYQRGSRSRDDPVYETGVLPCI